MSKYNNYYNRAKSGYNSARKGYTKTVSFGKRVKENYDIVLVTVGAVLLLSLFGFPLTSKTETIEIVNPKK